MNIDNGKVTLSDAEKWLIRTVKRTCGGTPTDWSAKQIASETSSFLDWSDWIQRHESVFEGAKSLIEQFLKNWGADDHRDMRDRYPAYSKFAAWYDAATNRRKVSDTKRSNCPHCHGSGYVAILMIKFGSSKSIVYRRGMDLTEKAYSTWRNMVPCQCVAGDAEAQKLNYGNDKRRRLFACRYDSLSAMLDDAISLCGGVPLDQRETPTAKRGKRKDATDAGTVADAIRANPGVAAEAAAQVPYREDDDDPDAAVVDDYADTVNEEDDVW